MNAVGAEGEVSRGLGAVELRAAFTYTHARVDGGGAAPQLTGLKPAQTPSTTLTAGASWRVDNRLTVIGDVRYESARFDDDQNTRRIDSGTGVNAKVEWALDQGLNVFIAADNLFNADIETGRTAANIVSYDTPRIIRFGIALRR